MYVCVGGGGGHNRNLTNAFLCYYAWVLLVCMLLTRTFHSVFPPHYEFTFLSVCLFPNPSVEHFLASSTPGFNLRAFCETQMADAYRINCPPPSPPPASLGTTSGTFGTNHSMWFVHRYVAMITWSTINSQLTGAVEPSSMLFLDGSVRLARGRTRFGNR